MLAVDLGQSGARIQCDGLEVTSQRAKLAGENPVDSLRAIFNELPPLRSDIAALSLTGFNGIVTDEDRYGALCHEFFGATRTAVIDDGLAGYIGTLDGRHGVTLLIGGGVVSVGGKNGTFAHRDGLGSIFGDEGSGYWLGKHGLTRALAIEEDRDEDKTLLPFMKSKVEEFHALDTKNGAEAASLAISAAKSLLMAADAGVEVALEIRNLGARLLARTIASTWRGVNGSHTEELDIVINGGLSQNPGYYQEIQARTLDLLPQANFVEPLGDNLSGARWIALNMHQDAPPMLRWSKVE